MPAYVTKAVKFVQVSPLALPHLSPAPSRWGHIHDTLQMTLTRPPKVHEIQQGPSVDSKGLKLSGCQARVKKKDTMTEALIYKVGEPLVKQKFYYMQIGTALTGNLKKKKINNSSPRIFLGR